MHDLNNLYTKDLPQDFLGAYYTRESIQFGKLEIEGLRLLTQQDLDLV